MYDLIGDIHGHCSTLKKLLQKLGYKESDNVWKHDSRTAIFVGDYIDRGPEIKQTLDLVKAMTDAGSAIALMGNHEYNAVAYATKDEQGNYYRSHSPVHTKQHQATLDQFAASPDEWKSYLQWFRQLPLFLELPELRAVHACWDAAHIDWLRSNNYLTLTDELLHLSNIRGSQANLVIEETLKGKEFAIPAAYVWCDKDGHARVSNRIKWWKQPGSATYGDLLFSCPPEMQDEKVPDDISITVYPEDAPPVFIGHYWLEDEFPVIQAENVICLDYSVAKDGPLVGYRFDWENKIDNKHFVFVK
jgi:hypothetical protein